MEQVTASGRHGGEPRGSGHAAEGSRGRGTVHGPGGRRPVRGEGDGRQQAAERDPPQDAVRCPSGSPAGRVARVTGGPVARAGCAACAAVTVCGDIRPHRYGQCFRGGVRGGAARLGRGRSLSLRCGADLRDRACGHRYSPRWRHDRWPTSDDRVRSLAGGGRRANGGAVRRGPPRPACDGAPHLAARSRPAPLLVPLPRAFMAPPGMRRRRVPCDARFRRGHPRGPFLGALARAVHGSDVPAIGHCATRRARACSLERRVRGAASGTPKPGHERSVAVPLGYRAGKDESRTQQRQSPARRRPCRSFSRGPPSPRHPWPVTKSQNPLTASR